MHSGAFVWKRANHDVPMKTLEHMLKNNGTIVGAAYLLDGAFQISGLGKDATAKVLNDFQQSIKDKDLWFFFGKHATDFSQESEQPFFTIADDKSIDVVAFIDGSLETFGEPQSAHSNAFFHMQKVVAPYLRSFWPLMENNSQKLFAFLKQDIHKTTWSNQLQNRTAMMLVNKFGEVLLWEHKNEEGREATEWGFVSNKYGAAAQESPVTAENTAPSLGARRSVPPAGTSSKVPEGVHVRSGPETIVHPPETKEETVKTTRMEQPPKEVWGDKQQAKRWYRMYINKAKELPEGWDSKTNPPAIEVTVTVSKANLDAMNNSTALATNTVKDTAASEDVTKNALPIPVLPPQQVKTVKETFMKDAVIAKVLDETGNAINSPRELLAAERKHVPFTDYYNWPNLSVCYGIGYEKLVDFANKFPRSAALLTFDAVYALAQAHEALEKAGIKPPWLEGKEAPTTKVEVPVQNQQQPQPAALGGGRRKTMG